MSNYYDVTKAKKAYENLDSDGKNTFYQLLFQEEKLDYPSMSRAYVYHLESLNKNHSLQIIKAGQLLAHYWLKDKSKNIFYKAAVAYWVIRNGVMKTAPIEGKMRNFLEENPYEEDQYGMPKTGIKK